MGFAEPDAHGDGVEAIEGHRGLVFEFCGEVGAGGTDLYRILNDLPAILLVAVADGEGVIGHGLGVVEIHEDEAVGEFGAGEATLLADLLRHDHRDAADDGGGEDGKNGDGDDGLHEGEAGAAGATRGARAVGG